jgi:hypothetical protein
MGSPSAAERHVELYYIERLLPFFFLGGRQKGEKRSPLKLSIEVNKNTKFSSNSQRSDIDFQSSVVSSN